MIGLMTLRPSDAACWAAHLAALERCVHPLPLEQHQHGAWTCWVVVLPPSFAPARARFWLRACPVPLLLLTPHIQAGLAAARVVHAPLIVMTPADARRDLAAALAVLERLTQGHVAWQPSLIHGSSPWIPS